MEQHSLGSSPDLVRWQVFRERIYTEVFTQGRDALFELMDALLEQGPVPSLVELSLSPFFRRAWPSVYAALRDGRIDSEALGRLAVDHGSAELAERLAPGGASSVGVGRGPVAAAGGGHAAGSGGAACG